MPPAQILLPSASCNPDINPFRHLSKTNHLGCQAPPTHLHKQYYVFLLALFCICRLFCRSIVYVSLSINCMNRLIDHTFLLLHAFLKWIDGMNRLTHNINQYINRTNRLSQHYSANYWLGARPGPHGPQPFIGRWMTLVNRWMPLIDRLLLAFCGSNLIVGQLWHESDCWSAVTRILLASQPANQPASQLQWQ